MSLLEQTAPASYKGVSFLVSLGRLTGGRKDVKHEFPNSDNQTIEDLGLLPRSYRLDMIITGADYFQARDSLLAVLEEGGPGPLVHPFYGRIENLVARSYTLIESFSALGEGKISAVFEPSLDTGIPQGDVNTIGNLADKNATLQAAMVSDISDGFLVSPNFSSNFTDAVNEVNSMVETAATATQALAADAQRIDEFNQALSNLSDNVFSLVLAPAELADSINGIFIGIDNLYTTPGATVDALRRIFGYGEEDAANDPPQTTAGLIQRVKNREILRASMNVMSLGYAYLNAVQIQFNTTEEVDTVADGLEEQYQSILMNPGISEVTESALVETRLAAQSFFNNARLIARQVIPVYTVLTSPRLLSYQYYGTSEDGELLGNLNSVADMSFIEGDIEVLSA